MTSEVQPGGEEAGGRVWGRRVWLVCLGLVVGTLAVYAQVRGFSFLQWDDQLFFDDNPYVRGLSWENIAWTVEIHGPGQWHPLTWWVHQLNYEFFGLEPGGHHLVNVLLHIAASVALLFAFWRLTGGFWPSALVAALFAWHPLSVESVAWASHLRDSLSALFWGLAMWAYADYARQGGRRRYLLVLGLFALGLMSKPVLITFPCVLLLLDYWPLRRIARFGEIRRVVLEKVPFFVLAGISAWLCFLCQSGDGAVASLDTYSVGARLANAAQSYVLHVWHILWPSGLAHIYPFPTSFEALKVAGAVLLLLGVSGAAFRYGRSKPYLLVGWLWYLGTLAPVIGLLKLGAATSMTDHHGYLSRLGIYLVIAWGLAGLVEWRPAARRGVVVGVGLVLLLLLPLSWKQAGVWQNDYVLNEHALAVTKDNYIARTSLGDALRVLGREEAALENYEVALRIAPDYAVTHNNKGNALQALGRTPEAVVHFEEALRIRPGYVEARYNLGNAVKTLGQPEEAVAHYEEVLRMKPDFAEGHNNLGNTLQALGRNEEAAAHFAEALRIRPDFARAQFNWGYALQDSGRLQEAIIHYEEALRIEPGLVKAQFNLGAALEALGRHEEAISRYEEVLRRNPDLAAAHGKLAWLMAASRKKELRDGERALEHARRYLALAGEEDSSAVAALAAAHAELGDFEKAVSWQEKALRLAPGQLREDFSARLELYRRGMPYRLPD